MCGRLACGLDPEQIKNCCSYMLREGTQAEKPVWKPLHNAGKIYKPSYNICPTEVAPVLISGTHFGLEARTIAPMLFGLIPSWSKPNATSKYSTINCRIEHVKSSKLYGPLLEKGQRCIVICNGFFEWKKEGKQSTKPYFIHSKQPESVSIVDPKTWNINHDESEKSDNNGLKLLKMAALFEKHIEEGSNFETYSFTIMTMESNSKMSWLHHRMPAVLDTEEQIEIWLESKNFDVDKALESLKHFENILWYPVSTTVNATSNKDLNCIKPTEESSKPDKKQSGSSKFLNNWLGKRTAAECKNSVNEDDFKRKKN